MVARIETDFDCVRAHERAPEDAAGQTSGNVDDARVLEHATEIWWRWQSEAARTRGGSGATREAYGRSTLDVRSGPMNRAALTGLVGSGIRPVKPATADDFTIWRRFGDGGNRRASLSGDAVNRPIAANPAAPRGRRSRSAEAAVVDAAIAQKPAAAPRRPIARVNRHQQVSRPQLEGARRKHWSRDSHSRDPGRRESIRGCW